MVDQPSPSVLLWFTRKRTTNNKNKTNKTHTKTKAGSLKEYSLKSDLFLLSFSLFSLQSKKNISTRSIQIQTDYLMNVFLTATFSNLIDTFVRNGYLISLCFCSHNFALRLLLAPISTPCSFEKSMKTDLVVRPDVTSNS